MRLLRVVQSTLVAAAFVACSSNSSQTTKSDPREAEVGQTASNSVGASGGTLATSSGSASVSVPAGALPGNVALTVSVKAASSAPNPNIIGSAVYDFGPNGTVFTQPVNVAVKLVSSVPSGQKAVLAYLDSSNTWQALANSTVKNGVVSAPVTHFTQFAVILISSTGAGCSKQADPNGYCDAGQVCTNDACAAPGTTNPNPTTSSYSVGGTISGLKGTLVLKNNGTDSLTLNANNANFVFATTLQSGGNYAVTVGTQPSQQTCTVANGSGKVGSANITNVAVSCTSTSTSATVTSIALSPSNLTLAPAATQQYSARATYSDSSTADASSGTWTSSSPSVATISASGLATAVAAGTTSISVTFGGVTQATTLTVSAATTATLSSISLTDAEGGSVVVGTTDQYIATAIYSDNSHSDISGTVAWTSSSPNVATVSASGLVTALSAGTTNLTATSGSVSQQATVTVSAATLTSLAVTSTNTTFSAGSTSQFTATGVYSNGSHQNLNSAVTWSSSNSAIFTVDSNGLVSGLTVGNANVVATLGTVSGNSRVVITGATLSSIGLSSSEGASIAAGTHTLITAVGTFSDNTTLDITQSATWTSSNSAVATVQAGSVKGVAVGTAIITATAGSVSKTFSLTVTAATLSSIGVTDAQGGSIAIGSTDQLTATGAFSDNSSQNLTQVAATTWTSSNAQVASINQAGLVNAVATGSVTITASNSGISQTFALTVTDAALASISLSDAQSATIAAGSTDQLTATGVYTDSTHQDITATVTWTSGNSAVATVDNSGLVTSTTAGSVVITATSGQITQNFTLTVTAATLASIQLSDAQSASIAVDTTDQITATGIYTDGTHQDLTNSVAWDTTDAALATISATGLATGVSAGNVHITAAQGQVTARFALAVTASPLSTISLADSESGNVAAGSTDQLTATGHYGDGTTQDLSSTVSWTVDDSTVANVDAVGLVTTIAAGTVTITAASGTIAESFTLAVSAATLSSINVSDAQQGVIPLGTTDQLTATGHYSDSSHQDLSLQVTWTIDDSSVATVDTTGLVSAVSAGSAVVTATLSGVSKAFNVTVTAATLASIDISDTESGTIVSGTTDQLTATGTYSDTTSGDISSDVTWTVDDASLATVDPTGLLTGTAAGTVTVTATLNGVHNSFQVVISAAALSSISISDAQLGTLAAGTQDQLTATGLYADNSSQDLTTQVSWTVDNAHIADVDANGLVTGHLAGTATITAAFNSVTQVFQVDVTAAVITSIGLTDSQGGQIAISTTDQFDAVGNYSDNSSQHLGNQATWDTDDHTIATVDPDGNVTGVAAGTVHVTAAFQGMSQSFTLTVSTATITSITLSDAANSALAIGALDQFLATGAFSDGTGQNLNNDVTWGSDNTSIATVDPHGMVTAVAAGNANITATFGGQTGSFALTVSAATLSSITVSDTEQGSIALGTQDSLSAEAIYSDNSSADISNNVTWISDNPGVATTSNTGVVTAVSIGTANITASSGFVTSANFVVTVTAATLTDISFTDTGAGSIAAGTTDQVTATGIYSDSSHQDISSTASWVSNDPSIATVDSTGFVTAIAAGNVNITASSGSISRDFSLTVTNATLVSIALSDASSGTVAAGFTDQMTATGTYTDQSTPDVTSQALWDTDDHNVATVDQTGLVTAVAVGTTNVTATIGTVSQHLSLTVTAATLTSIALTDLQGGTVALDNLDVITAIGTFSDSSTSDISSTVTWTVDSTAGVSVDSSGNVTPKTAGNVVVTATLNGVHEDITLVVSSATLASIAITDTLSGNVPANSTDQLSATGTYSDNTTEHVDGIVTWTSADTSVATVSVTGLVTGVASGSTTIQAAVNSVTTTFTITVP